MEKKFIKNGNKCIGIRVQHSYEEIFLKENY